ncbi:MAG: iron ABC transporter permease [Actinomycetota bacterium]
MIETPTHNGQERGTARTRRPSRFPRPRALPAASAVVCALLLLPLLYLVIRGTQATPAGWRLILRWETVELALRSLGLAAAVTAASTLLGVPAAWLATRSDLPGRRIWAVLFALPLVIPSYIAAMTFLSSLGPKGLFQQLLEPLGIERLPDIGGFVGAAIVLTAVSYPYVYLVTAAGIRGLDPSLEEAARTLGRTPIQVFRHVTVPMLRPAIAAGGLLVALYTLHDFGGVSLMRFTTFTQAIYLQYKAAFDRAPAAILSMMLVLIALVVVVAEQRQRGRAAYHRSGGGSKRPPGVVPLGSWRTPALLFAAGLVAFTFLLPAGVLLYWAIRGLLRGGPLNLTLSAAGSSVLVSGIGAALAILAAAPVALYTARSRSRGARLAEPISYAGFALPGIVVALALVFITARFAPVIYQSLFLVAIAYVILFFPQASEPMRMGLRQLDPHVEQAARTMGARPVRVVRWITLPQILPPTLAGAALVFLTAMKELPATLLLRPTGFETLATRVWTSASAGLFSKAAVPALLLLVLSAIPLFFLAGRIDVEEVRPD